IGVHRAAAGYRSDGSERPAGARARDHRRRQVPGPGSRDRVGRGGQARRPRALAHRRPGPRRHRGPSHRPGPGLGPTAGVAHRGWRGRGGAGRTAHSGRSQGSGRSSPGLRGGTAMTDTTTAATAATAATTTAATNRTPGGVGESPNRPDGTLKVRGEFAYSSDLWLDDALFGVTLRSPYPRARILGIDASAALAMPDVYAVLTHEDVPGS